MKKIKKIATSIGVLGKILNSKSSSKQDTYSCDYINKDTEIAKLSVDDFITLNNEFSIPMSSLYKQGKHIFGYLTILKKSKFNVTQESIGNCKYHPIEFINIFGVSGTGDYYGIPTDFAYAYITETGNFLVKANNTEIYIKCYIDYVTN